MLLLIAAAQSLLNRDGAEALLFPGPQLGGRPGTGGGVSDRIVADSCLWGCGHARPVKLRGSRRTQLVRRDPRRLWGQADSRWPSRRSGLTGVGTAAARLAAAVAQPAAVAPQAAGLFGVVCIHGR